LRPRLAAGLPFSITSGHCNGSEIRTRMSGSCFAGAREAGFVELRKADVSLRRIHLLRGWVNREGVSCFSRACLAQRSCPSRDRMCSSPERSPDRPMALRTAPNVIAAPEPQITPIKVPRATSPLHHKTPKLTSTDTTKNTTVDNITVPASLARILHPIVCVRLCDAPDPLRCRTVTNR
jgi:hypothetical protein